MNQFQPLIDRNVTFDISFKYARARLYSDTKPLFSQGVFRQLPKGIRMWCNLRNDDIFILRWADPDYVREYIQNIPAKDKCPGFVMGADGYIFAKEFICRHPDTAGKLEMDKHWLKFMLWGRLGYNPALKNNLFQKAIGTRFPEADATKIYSAWTQSSKIIPLINRFYWQDWDFHWHVESGSAFKRQNTHSIQRLIRKGKPMEGTNLLSIETYCARTLADGAINGVTPLQVADQLDDFAEKAMASLPTKTTGDQELRETLDDIQAMVHLGSFYADRIRGAVSLSLYEKTKQDVRHHESVRYLTASLAHWKAYAKLISTNYKSQLLARIGWVDMLEMTKVYEADIPEKTEPAVQTK